MLRYADSFGWLLLSQTRILSTVDFAPEDSALPDASLPVLPMTVSRPMSGSAMEVGGPDAICGSPPSEDENEGPVSSSFSLRTNPQLLQTISPLSSSLMKVPFFPQFGHLSGISIASLSAGSWSDCNRERLQSEPLLFTQALALIPSGTAHAAGRGLQQHGSLG